MSTPIMIISAAQFSECNKYRYFLLRRWDLQRPLALCIGLNPSTAGSIDNDPTISSLIRIMDHNGYGGFYMMNLFALISPYPEDLRTCPDPVKDNDLWMDIIRKDVNHVIFCWGAFKQAEYRAKLIKARFRGGVVKVLGYTADGSPMHPLFKKKTTELRDYIY